MLCKAQALGEPSSSFISRKLERRSEAIVWEEPQTHPNAILTHMKSAIATVSCTIAHPQNETFWYVVPVDLSHIFKKYKYLPAVTSTSVTKEWRTAGLSRIVTFSDGSTARETLTSVNEPSGFSYTIDSFTSILRLLAREIHGTWVFTTTTDGQTAITWTYEITPTNRLASFLLRTIVIKDIRHLLDRALHTIKRDLEN